MDAANLVMATIFAEEGTAWIVAGSSAFVGILSLIGTGIMGLLVWRDKHRRLEESRRRAARKDTLDEWREIVARQDGQIKQLQEAQDHCRRREAAMTNVIMYLHGFIGQQSELLRKAGLPASDPMPLKELLTDLEISQFEARSLKQNTTLLHEEATRIKTEPGSPS